MTRKDFEVIARALYNSQPHFPDVPIAALEQWERIAALEQWERTLVAFQLALPSTNPNFNAEKFERYASTGKY